MLKTMRTIAAAALAAGLTLTTGCTSSKELNEKSARSLLKDLYAKVHYPIPVSIIAPLMTRSPASYGRLVDTLKEKQVKENVAVYIVKRLVDANLVTEKVDTINYPNIRGKFRSDNRYDFDEYDLSMTPNTNRITGIRDQQCQSCANHHQSNVNGMVDESGLVTLPNGRFRYKEEGGAAYLMDTDRFNVTNYKGAASGSTVAMKWYTYAYSPDLKAQIEKTQMPTFGGFGSAKQETLNGGGYDIGDVSDLQLGITPTMASASFAWTASLNKVGKIFYAEDVPKGKGRVTFVRKPDETWVIKDWCVTNCMF
jgi:hypothetical protein